MGAVTMPKLGRVVCGMGFSITRGELECAAWRRRAGSGILMKPEPCSDRNDTEPRSVWQAGMGGSWAVAGGDSRSGPAAPRKRADARRNEATLLDAAAALFLESGVNAPVRDIAAK